MFQPSFIIIQCRLNTALFAWAGGRGLNTSVEMLTPADLASADAAAGQQQALVEGRLHGPAQIDPRL